MLFLSSHDRRGICSSLHGESEPQIYIGSNRTTGIVAECEYCGSETGDPQVCPECGGVYCHDHEQPLTHECEEIEAAVGEGVIDPTVTPGEDQTLGSVGGTIVWTGVVLGTVVLLVGAGVATGVISPCTVLPCGDDGTPAGFDTEEFRGATLEQINEMRNERDVGDLQYEPRHDEVADRIAADMASVRFFEIQDAKDDPRFDPAQRLEDNGYECAVTNRGWYRTAFDRPLEGEDVRITSTDQAAERVSEMLRRDLADDLFDEDPTTHTLGVHVTEENAIYVVYLTC